MSKVEEKKSFIKKVWREITNHKKIAIFLIILLVAGAVLKNTVFKNTQQPALQTTSVQRTSIVSTVSLSGQILSTNIVNITTSASGIVKSVNVKDGDTVKTGDVIANITLDSPGQQQFQQTNASYLASKNSLDSANIALYSTQADMFTNWKKFTDLSTNTIYTNSDGSPNNGNRNAAEFIVAQDNWLEAEAKYKQQQSVITQAQADLSSKYQSYLNSSPNITAPISGTVNNIGIIPGMVLGSQGSSVSVGTGGSVSSSQNGQNVAVIQNEGKPVATFNASELDIPKLKIGQKATIKIDAISDKTFTGKVGAIDKIGTVSSGVTNYKVLVSLDTESASVLPNMAATANVILDSRNDVLTVPSSAIQSQAGLSTVRILKDGKTQTVNVETGLTSDTETEITTGLSEGDQVITGTSTSTNGTGNTQRNGQNSPFGAGGGGFFRTVGGGGGGR